MPHATPRTARARSAALLAAAAVAAMLALPGTAVAQVRSCSDFSTQQEAQAALDQDRDDPGNLDSNDNGVACETLPRGDAGTPAADAGARALAVTTDSPTSTVTTTPDAAALVATDTTTGTTGTTTTGTTTTGTTTDTTTTTAPCTTTVTATTTPTTASTTATTTSTAVTTTTTAPTTTTGTTAETTTTTTTGSCSTTTVGGSSGGDSDGDGDSDGGSSGTDDRDCTDFSSQSDAQAALDADSKDPDNLDADDDGIACEDRFGSPDQQVQVLPSGGVDTGGDPVDG